MPTFGSVTPYDGVMALIVFFTMVHGFWKGAAWQIAPIMSLVLGYMIAMPMSVTTAHYFGDPPQNRLFALVSIYLGVTLIVYLMVRSFRAGIEKAKLTEFDRHIGALLGVVKGILITLAITVVLLIYSSNARELILKSESSTIAARIINAVYPILPQAMHQLLRPYLKELQDDLPLDLRDSDVDKQLNPGVIPDHNSPLTPTRATAQRAFDDGTGTEPRRRVRTLVQDDDDQGLPPAPPPRGQRVQVQEQQPPATRRYQSAASTNSRYADDDRNNGAPTLRPTVTPTENFDDDPFTSRSNDRSRTRSR